MRWSKMALVCDHNLQKYFEIQNSMSKQNVGPKDGLVTLWAIPFFPHYIYTLMDAQLPIKP